VFVVVVSVVNFLLYSTAVIEKLSSYAMQAIRRRGNIALILP
jgi:hypothetical protein